MSRYSDIKKYKNHYGINIYPLIKPKEDDTYIITIDGDRLDILAYEYYGDSTLWWIIASANNMRMDSIFPPSGLQLRIPSNVSDYLNSYKNVNKR